MGLTQRQIPEGVEPVFLPRKSRWIVGVDLGQSSDPSAICVLENVEGVLDYNTPHERHTNTGLIPQKKAQRFLVKHLERLPLGLSYPVQIQHVSELLARPPLTGDPAMNTPPATLVVDDTGVGRAVSDLMLERGMEPMRVTIVAGNEQTVTRRNRWNVPKALLISGLDAHLHSGNLKIAGALTES
jgi:hypothetical protein